MPTDKSIRQIRSQAAKHGVPFDAKASTLAGRKTKIQVLYTGGGLISRLLDGPEIAITQLGCNGDWAAILPLRDLLKLLETELLQVQMGRNNSPNLQQ